MKHVLNFIVCLMMVTTLVGCNSSVNEEVDTSADSKSVLKLPTDDTPMTVTGNMNFWFVEGEAGCYAEIIIDGVAVDLYSEIDVCDPLPENAENHIPKNFSKGQKVTFDISFKAEHQFMAEDKPLYTITKLYN